MFPPTGPGYLGIGLAAARRTGPGYLGILNSSTAPGTVSQAAFVQVRGARARRVERRRNILGDGNAALTQFPSFFSHLTKGGNPVPPPAGLLPSYN